MLLFNTFCVYLIPLPSPINFKKTMITDQLNIRAAIPTDLGNLKAVIASSQLFPAELLDEMIAGFFSGKEESIWLTVDGPGPTAVAYCAPEQMTEGTWNLYLIAVHETMKGRGIGKKIIEHLEAELKARKVRILIVETSGLPEYEASQAFYVKRGFQKEAVVREFYAEGEDKIVYWKKLQE